jgi:hypothetical protein
MYETTTPQDDCAIVPGDNNGSSSETGEDDESSFDSDDRLLKILRTGTLRILGWACELCTLHNKASDTMCLKCGQCKSTKTSEASGSSSGGSLSGGASGSSSGGSYSGAAPGTPNEPLDGGRLTAMFSRCQIDDTNLDTQWACPKCTLDNDASNTECDVCLWRKPRHTENEACGLVSGDPISGGSHQGGRLAKGKKGELHFAALLVSTHVARNISLVGCSYVQGVQLIMQGDYWASEDLISPMVSAFLLSL